MSQILYDISSTSILELDPEVVILKFSHNVWVELFLNKAAMSWVVVVFWDKKGIFALNITLILFRCLCSGIAAYEFYFHCFESKSVLSEPNPS